MTERILIVDDEADMAALLELALRGEGYDVRAVTDGEQALEAAIEFLPDLVVLDVMMPRMDGMEVCKRLRADHRTASIPVIMLTARALPGDRVAGLDAGADDYVTKPFDPAELSARVRTTLRRAHGLRGTSPLTGLPGNFEIERLLDRLIADSVPFALLHADLDNFKAYNDRYGFVRGDHVIRETAGLLDEIVAHTPREPLFLGHIGGDDFAIVTHPDVAEDVAGEITTTFATRIAGLYDADDLARGTIVTVDRRGRRHRHPLVTISVGIASTTSRAFVSAAHAAAVATEMKQLAKQAKGSAWRLDRRRS